MITHPPAPLSRKSNSASIIMDSLALSKSIFQKELHNGYNWVSFPVLDRKQDVDEDTEEELNRVLQSICPNGITLTDANYLNSSFLFSANLWEGLIPCVISSKGYKINMVKRCSI